MRRWCWNTPARGWRWSNGHRGCGLGCCSRCWRICLCRGGSPGATRVRSRSRSASSPSWSRSLCWPRCWPPRRCSSPSCDSFGYPNYSPGRFCWPCSLSPPPTSSPCRREDASMSDANFAILVDFAAGGLMLTAVLIVWRRDLRAVVRLFAWQGLALAAIPLLRGARDGEVALIYVGITILALRAVALPWLLARALAAEQRDQREATPLVNTASSLLITAVLTVAAFAITRPLVNLEPSAAATAVPAVFAVVFIALFVMATRRHAISQAAGFLMLDNGIAATAFLLTAGVPLIVELGASLDVLFAVIVIGVLTGRLRRAFGGADLDALRELRD